MIEEVALVTSPTCMHIGRWREMVGDRGGRALSLVSGGGLTCMHIGRWREMVGDRGGRALSLVSGGGPAGVSAAAAAFFNAARVRFHSVLFLHA